MALAYERAEAIMRATPSRVVPVPTLCESFSGIWQRCPWVKGDRIP
jgi:hypothetical protein